MGSKQFMLVLTRPAYNNPCSHTQKILNLATHMYSVKFKQIIHSMVECAAHAQEKITWIRLSLEKKSSLLVQKHTHIR
jgi:SpoU rRNA methylase family enzyme